ncbi:EF-P 5-aminopentanol modification-associated protein YfmF [Alteribacter natronophilus]|uniref:EF-P 5-aminopentanol modification-associated protein YfmF n=1 Tax=Alteribacter natronophilus TaxID=2583810 RepID=UPI00110E05A4|nr:pitrilysin family protein [Alteribacter natronophilus]TMW73267.1 insulinase family protein [Alteribacter natronophilus]
MEAINVNEFSHGPVNVHVIKSDTYKTNTLVLHIRADLTEEDHTMRALLPQVLQSGSKDYPTRQKIRQELDGLYGATLAGDVNKKGENHLISFKLEVANEKYLKDSTPLLEQAFKMMTSVVTNPLAENGAFRESIVKSEKRNLKQRIQSVYDDKIRYANMRLNEEMCKDEPYGLFVYGNEDQLDSITPEELYAYYERVMKEDLFDLYVVGDVETDEIKRLVEGNFSLPGSERRKEKTPSTASAQEEADENEIFEEQDLSQGKLHLGYRTNVTYQDDDYFALQLFNGLFGGFSHSKLFINVREKASLAYYAASRVESHKGLLMVMSGIETSNYEKAVTIIREQMEAMKNGDFEEEQLEQTKSVLKNQLLETMDAPRGLVELLYHNELGQRNRKLDEWIPGIEKVTKEDVIRVAGQAKLDTIYFLKGMEGGSDE